MLAQEVDNKVNVGQAHANTSEAANDLDAAKVAAMKAAELGTQYFYIYVIDIWYFMTVPWFWRVLFILHALLLGLSGPMIWNKKISQVP